MAYRVKGLLQEGKDKKARWPVYDWSNAATAAEAIHEVFELCNPTSDSMEEPAETLDFVGEPLVEYVRGIWISDGSWGAASGGLAASGPLTVTSSSVLIMLSNRNNWTSIRNG